MFVIRIYIFVDLVLSGVLLVLSLRHSPHIHSDETIVLTCVLCVLQMVSLDKFEVIIKRRTEQTTVICNVNANQISGNLEFFFNLFFLGDLFKFTSLKSGKV